MRLTQPHTAEGVAYSNELVGGTGHYLNSQLELAGGVLDLVRTHSGCLPDPIVSREDGSTPSTKRYWPIRSV